MDIILIIIMSLLLAAFLFFKLGDIFSPWTITTVIWLAIEVMFLFQGDLLYPLGNQFHSCLALWLPIFCASAMVTYYVLPRGNTDQTLSDIPDINQALFNLFYVISMVITPLYLYKIMQVVMMFDSSDMLNNIRMLAVYGDENYGFLNYSYVLNQVLLVVGLWRYPKVPLWQLITIIIASLMSAFAIMEKGMLFFLFAGVLFVLYEKRVIKMRSILISSAVLILVFFLFTTARSYREDADPNEDLTFLDFFAIYVLSPAVAFEYVEEDLTPQLGSHTFQTIYMFLNRFGGDYEVNAKIQEFVWVPLPTNVYTVFQPFFEDFKYKGVALFAMFYGVFSGLAYRMARNGNSVGKCLYVYVVYVLALQFFQENVMMSIVNVIQFTFFTTLVCQQRIGLGFFIGADRSHTPQAPPESSDAITTL
ncbi:MAG: oligosaccharide repeat unit polymerase [Prevotella sp.]|nr:oligosaccharide repeat unit polymerase [Prevotella sp.]